MLKHLSKHALNPSKFRGQNFSLPQSPTHRGLGVDLLGPSPTPSPRWGPNGPPGNPILASNPSLGRHS
jgi:hypothetical protein